MSELNITQMSPSEFLSLFNRVIDSCRNILRTDGITGMDSMKHLTLYILARVLSVEECKRLSISQKFSWDKFMELLKQDKKQEAFNLFFCKNGAESDLIGALDEKFNTKNFNYKLNKIELHASILKELNKIDLNNLDGHVDILGTVYENHLGSGSNKSAMRDLGQFFTDRKVCNYMVNLCQPKLLGDKRAESVLDPTMGTGGFLTSYVKYLQENGHTIDWSKMQDDVVGCDIDEFVVSIGEINMYLSTGVLFDRISHRDSLQKDVGEPHQRLKFKIILANEPFGVKGLKFADSCKRVKDIGINGTKSEPLFLNLMMAALDIDGRCAVVVPDGVLVNNSNQHNGTRKYLLDNFELKRVIKMKGQFFSNTGIQPSILFFENTGCPTSVVEFWEVEQGSDSGIIENMLLAVPREKFDDACSLDLRRYQEVAVLANTGGFPMVKLGDVCNDVSTAKNIPSSERVDGEFKFFTCSRDYATHNEFHYEGTYIVHGSRGSTIDESVFLTKNEKFAIGTSMFLSKVKNEEELQSEFLYYYLKLNSSIVNTHVNSTAIPMISKTNYYTIEIPLPPLPIQQEIVTALDLIYNNAAIAKTAAASMKCQMAAVVRSVGARGFERKKLGDIVDIEGGDYITKSSETAGEYPVYGGGAASYHINRFNREPTCVINKDGMSASCVQMVNTRFFLNHHGWTLKLKSAELIERFLHWQLYFRTDDIFTLATGSCQKGLNQKEFTQFMIYIPPLPIQHEVLAILNEMEAELATLEHMAAKAEQRAKFILDGYLTPAPQAIEAEPVTSQTEEKPVKKRVFKIARDIT
jgi:type I restriction enzyme M protein